MTTETNLPAAPNPASAALPTVDTNGDAAYEIPAWAIPDYDKIVVEDNAPVESVFAEKQFRLLTESLYTSWAGPGEGRTFAAFANVGLFMMMDQPPVVPDVMVTLDLTPRDPLQRENRSYFIWVVGKAPDVVVELVSDRRGGEDGDKKAHYAASGVPYYVIFDPEEWLGSGMLRSFELKGRTYQPLADHWLPDVRLGVKLWEGAYENTPALWLRWCDREGRPIPTGAERVAIEQERAEQERQRRERLEAQLRALGQEPTA
jgi:hypothetical protein